MVAGLGVLLSGSVLASVVHLELTQSRDVNCDGIADTALGANPISVMPGQCILYQVSAENIGYSIVTNLVLQGKIPTYTKLRGYEATVINSGDRVMRSYSRLLPGVENKLSFRYWVRVSE